MQSYTLFFKVVSALCMNFNLNEEIRVRKKKKNAKLFYELSRILLIYLTFFLIALVYFAILTLYKSTLFSLRSAWILFQRHKVFMPLRY